jgi:modulator of FtsH protease HflC
MNKNTLVAGGIVLVVLVLLGFGSTFTVNQNEQAIVFQLGEPVRPIQEPGLKFKIPLIQNVVYYDKRILNLDPPGEEVILADKKRIDVDAFARYRIVDPLLFYQTVRTEGEVVNRIGGLLNSGVRNELGRVPLEGLLSEQRHNIMSAIREQVNQQGKSFGIEVVDVRIGRADLPDQISKTVFDRMRSERVREANSLRADGDQIKQTITAEADRDVTVLLADANAESFERRGHGDGERTRITNEAFSKDQEFFNFYRSMRMIREGLDAANTTYVLSPENYDFLKYLRESPSAK